MCASTRAMLGLTTIVTIGTCWLIAGCGSGGSTGNDNSQPQTISAADCASTQADALITSTESGTLAVTSECDQIAVYEDENDELKTVVIAPSDGSDVTIEFEAGRPTGATTGTETTTVVYNSSQGFARVQHESEDGGTDASVVAIDREVASSASVAAGQSDTGMRFCDELLEMARLFTASCGEESPPRYCSGPLREAADAAVDLCTGERIEEFAAIDGLKFSGERRDVALHVDGFATTRRGAEDTATVVLAAVAFGGAGGYEFEWVMSDPADAAVVIQQLPGGTAVADVAADVEEAVFEVSVTDARGDTASRTVTIDLRPQSTRIVIQVSNTNPQPGEPVTFKAASVTHHDVAAADDGEYAWIFGDGSLGDGATVSHTYDREGSYRVALTQFTGRCDVGAEIYIQVGSGGRSEDDLSITLASDKDALFPGETATLTATVRGDVGEGKVGIGVIDGPGSVGGGREVDFADSTVLTADGAGLILAGALVVDSSGRSADTSLAIPVCSGEDELFAFIDGPFHLKADETATLVGKAVRCGAGDSELSYSWTIAEGPAALSSNRGREVVVTPESPGFVIVDLHLTDATGASATASIGIEVLAGRFGELFVAYLGPREVPSGIEVPVHSFIGGGEEPYFCSWQVDGATDGTRFDNLFTCNPTYLAPAGGCVFGRLKVSDAAGAFGETAFEICAGDFPLIDGDPCPFDGFCDEQCPIGDPDCFDGGLCAPGDGVCDHFCADHGPADPDCTNCPADGVCVFLCPGGPDPDCDGPACAHAADCDDFDACTVDFCDTGFCRHDFDPACGSGGCGHDADCDDFDACTFDQCDADGLCRHNRAPDCGGCEVSTDCDDFDPCTIDHCDAGHCLHEFDPACGGGCTSSADCADTDICTIDVCDGGVCVHDFDPVCANACFGSADCDDFDPCTTDICNFDTALCEHETDPACECGNGQCTGGEDCIVCPQDCGDCCGNGICDSGEDTATCPADCP